MHYKEASQNQHPKCKSVILYYSAFFSPDHWSVVPSFKDSQVTPIEVIAVIFCCFLFVMIVGGACCLFWSIKPERVTTDNHRKPQSAHREVPLSLAILCTLISLFIADHVCCREHIK